MERVNFIVVSLTLGVCAGFAQQQNQDAHFKAADVCARCHVISVVEWGMSSHRASKVGCVACHGESNGHVIDERNNIKPDRIPRREAVSALCATCHADGCPKTSQKAGCNTCHHFHALVDPRRPARISDQTLDMFAKRWDAAAHSAEEGERHLKAGRWADAKRAFAAALKERPGDARLAVRIALCERRLKPALLGFESTGEIDSETGLPKQVRVVGVGIALVLVPGGDAVLGSNTLPNTAPVHSVRVVSFYFGKFEVTQGEWSRIMGGAPGKAELPAGALSWDDCQAFLRELNERVPGGGFRLPTEAEWQHAAAAGTASPEQAWLDAPEAEFAPRAAGSRNPNRLGIYDMYGNVWEWCSSLFAPYPYDSSDGRESAAAPGLRVLRGGSFADSSTLDPALRHGERPARRLRWNGFRIARSIPEPD